MTVREIRRSIDGLSPDHEVAEPATPSEVETIEAIRELVRSIKGSEAEVVTDCGKKVMLRISETANDTTKYGRFLVSDSCDCEKSKFLCYPEDGACHCGIYKHHVHCAKCGGVSQVG